MPVKASHLRGCARQWLVTWLPQRRALQCGLNLFGHLRADPWGPDFGLFLEEFTRTLVASGLVGLHPGQQVVDGLVAPATCLQIVHCRAACLLEAIGDHGQDLGFGPVGAHRGGAIGLGVAAGERGVVITGL